MAAFQPLVHVFNIDRLAWWCQDSLAAFGQKRKDLCRRRCSAAFPSIPSVAVALPHFLFSLLVPVLALQHLDKFVHVLLAIVLPISLVSRVHLPFPLLFVPSSPSPSPSPSPSSPTNLVCPSPFRGGEARAGTVSSHEATSVRLHPVRGVVRVRQGTEEARGQEGAPSRGLGSGGARVRPAIPPG